MVGVAATSAEPFVRSCKPPIGTPKQNIYSLLNYHSLKPFVLTLVELTIQEIQKSTGLTFLGSALTTLVQGWGLFFLFFCFR